MVKPGYKQTEIGAIPENWEVATIGNIASFQGGSQPPIQHFVFQEQDGYIRLIQIRDYKTDKYLTYIPISLAKRFCTKDDIMIGRYGPPIFQILRGIEGSYNVALIKATPKDVDKEFLFYTLKAEPLFEYIDLLSRRSSGQTGVDLDGLREYKIGLPPVSEQKSIADALSNMDKLISVIEKQVAKKKAIKQGAMQELLTGKKRLPGFSGEWQYMEIGKHGTLIRESINPQLSPSDYFWEYSMPAFDNEKIPVKQIGSDMHSNRTVIYGKVLLFNKLNVRQKRIWMINQCRNRAVCSSEFLPYQSDKINLELLAQILNTDEVTLQFVGMSTGTSNSQKRITPNDFLEYKVYLPIDEDEQSAIAEVLVCMGKEIEALEKKLAKYRQIKQGMMQQLLTGKIRLV